MMRRRETPCWLSYLTIITMIILMMVIITIEIILLKGIDIVIDDHLARASLSI